MRRLFVICAIVAAFVGGLQAHSHAAQFNEKTYTRTVLTDGNELYGWCRTYREIVKVSDSETSLTKAGDPWAVFDAGHCTAYVRAVVDSLPFGEVFVPNSTVRLSQYVDVVYRYLDAHPEMRGQPASFLTRKALLAQESSVPLIPDGNWLLQVCKSELDDAYSSGECYRYIYAAIDKFYLDKGGVGTPSFCIPKTTSPFDWKKTVVNFLLRYHEKRTEYKAVELVGMALSDQWPCHM